MFFARHPFVYILTILLSLSFTITSGCSNNSDNNSPDQSQAEPDSQQTQDNDSDGNFIKPADAPDEETPDDHGEVDLGFESVRPDLATQAIRLSSQEYINRIKDVFGVDVPKELIPLDLKIKGFDLNITLITEGDLYYYWDAAWHVAGELMANPKKHFNCDITKVDQPCLEAFINTNVEKLYGYKPEQELISDLLSLYNKLTKISAKTATQGVIEAMLLSPRFLLNLEEKAKEKINARNLASRLARYLWVSVPDAELRQSAESGKLLDPEHRNQQIIRMMKDWKFKRSTEYFFSQLLGFYHIKSRYELSEEEQDNMIKESIDTINYLIAEGEGSFMDLFTSNISAGTPELVAKLYPESESLGNGLSALNENWRAGILMRKAFLAASSLDDDVSPIYRGLSIVENLLCREIDSPPVDVDETLTNEDLVSETGELLTTREMLETKHSNNPCAAACHETFEPLGYAFENYTALGEYRTTQHNKPINPTGNFLDADNFEIFFANAKELSIILGESDVTQTCFSKQLTGYAYKVEKTLETESSLPKFTDMPLHNIFYEFAISDNMLKPSYTN